jgi:hypothetical protein
MITDELGQGSLLRDVKSFVEYFMFVGEINIMED